MELRPAGYCAYHIRIPAKPDKKLASRGMK
jgi:hypothetical protein